MKRTLLAAAMCVGSAHSVELWLTVIGDVTNPAVDTVEVATSTVAREGELRLMKIRTHRMHERVTFESKPYRSYLGQIQIDCTAEEARFRELRYFRGPLWTGQVRDVAFPRDAMPKVVFRDVQPNPVQRIVRAACQGLGSNS